MLGTVGQILILIAFVACGLASLAYYQAAQIKAGADDWRRIARCAWIAMTGCVVAAWALLVHLLVTHQFQYAYVYQYSSRDLPIEFLVSSSWAGQEGSFLLWILFTATIGLFVMRWAREWEAPVLAVVALCQVFLLSMVVGLKIGAVPIGSSPFAMLFERFPDAPIFQQDPSFVPADGNGLNDLLRNYWMAIHPPTLFVGFSAMVVPFGYAVAALWKRRYTDWVRPALPWTLFAVMVLGIGIAMGGYWAYETLSFGGYWAWDPVENSSLVPWLVGVAALHTMIAQKKSGFNHKAALFLSILAFMLVVYSTFLTRSGILGDISVHSFVDLGMSNQLLVWIASMGAVGFGLFALRYRSLPRPDREPHPLSREFMIFAGAMLLCLVSAVILLGTSAPIFGRIFRDNPSAVPIDFYNRWTLPLAIGFTFLVGLGQLFWWQKMSVANVNRVLIRPIGLAVASTIAVLVLTPFVEATADVEALRSLAAAPPVVEAGLTGGLGSFWAVYGMGLGMLLLVFAAFFAFFGNGIVLLRIARGNPKLAGGALAHIGFVIGILGIVASSGFSRPLAEGTGLQMGDSRDNFVLERGQTRSVGGYDVTYRDQQPTEEGYTSYVLDFEREDGSAFTLAPVVYKSDKDQWIQHPDIATFFGRDLYAAVTPNVMFETESDDQGGELSLAPGDSVVLGSQAYKLTFAGFNPNVDPALLPDSAELAVAAILDVTNLQTGETRELRPIYLVMQDRSQQFLQNRVTDWGLTITFAGMNVDAGQARLVIEGVSLTPEDWLVVMAYEKPLIWLLWSGIILLSLGMTVSIARRVSDLRRRSTPTQRPLAAA